MSHQEQIDAFCSDITAVVDRYRAEFELPLASAVGGLDIVKHCLINSETKDSNED